MFLQLTYERKKKDRSKSKPDGEEEEEDRNNIGIFPLSRKNSEADRLVKDKK